MFNVDEIIKYEECKKFWFVPLSVDEVAIVSKDGDNTWKDNIIGVATVSTTSESVLQLDNLTEELSEDVKVDINTDWDVFKQRPEWRMITFAGNVAEVDDYEIQLTGAVLIKEFKATNNNPDRCVHKISRCLEWIRKTDFYICPASTQYHDSYKGGLLTHSLTVCDRAVSLLSADPFKSSVNIEDAIFVSLVHDWCKIGLYIPYKRNVKDESTGQWFQVEAYKYAEDRTICLGHGTSSMYMASKFFNVSMEEALAIRWHMGKWNVVDSEINELQQANRNYPLVHLIQFADQLAITNY